MKMGRIFLVLLLILLGCCEEASKSQRFPHKLWLYWHDPDINNVPVFIQLCVNNMRHYAAASGWELVLANNETIYQYFSQQSSKKIALIKQRLPHVLKTVNPQYLPDIYRTFLLHDNGGMWVDVSTIFVRNLSWVQNMEEQGLANNRLAKQPQVIMYTYDNGFGGNKTVIYDEKNQKDVYMFPGVQFWCMIAKPRSRFFSDMIDSYLYMVAQESFESFLLDCKKQGYVYINEADRYFAFSNLHMQTLMQKKQREIDSDPQDFDIKYAIQYYGIWSIDSIDSGFSLFHFYGWRERPIMHKLFYEPFSSFPERVRKDTFIKFNTDKRKDVMQFFDKALALDCRIEDGAFNQDSFFSQYLLKYSEDMPFVKKIRSLAARPKGWSESQCSNPQLNSVINKITSMLIPMATTFLFIAICLIACIKRLGTFMDDKVTKICMAKYQTH